MLALRRAAPDSGQTMDANETKLNALPAALVAWDVRRVIADLMQTRIVLLTGKQSHRWGA
jgi:hypothetical protein